MELSIRARRRVFFLVVVIFFYTLLKAFRKIIYILILFLPFFFGLFSSFFSFMLKDKTPYSTAYKANEYYGTKYSKHYIKKSIHIANIIKT